jgi:iron complex outermembrane receptor protein
LRWQHGLGQLASETVTGIDYYDGTVKAHLDGASFITTENQDATQKSTALYAQNTTELNGNWILNSGVRSQRMDQDASQGAYVADFGFGPFTTPGFSGNAVHTRTAYDLGLVYRDDGWRAYGKVGTTFRFPTTDELFAFDPFTGNPVFSGDLKPQHGNLGEIGASFDKGPAKGKVTLYRIDLSDEIGFDGNTFANVNLPDTRREGLESELAWNITSGLVAQVSYAYTDATFSAGPNTDKEIPLVSRNKASTQLTWYQGSVGTYSAVLSYVGNRRYSGDFANVRGELSGYTTMDLQASWNLNPWTITAKLLNAFDQRYAPFAGYSTFVNDHFFFPADARSLFVSARYQFK